MATIEELAGVLNVSRETVVRWRLTPPDSLDDVGHLKALATSLASKVRDAEAADAPGAPPVTPAFPQWVLNTGFFVGLLFSAGAFTAVGYYLHWFLQDLQKHAATSTNVAQITGQLIETKIALQSCGLFAGVALGFLGFALFLIGINSVMSVDAEGEGYQAKLVNVAPGTLVMLCAALLIGYCATREAKWETTTTKDDKGTTTTTSLSQFSSHAGVLDAIEASLTNLSRIGATSPEFTTKLTKLRDQVEYVQLMYAGTSEEHEKAASAYKAAGSKDAAERETALAANDKAIATVLSKLGADKPDIAKLLDEFQKAARENKKINE